MNSDNNNNNSTTVGGVTFGSTGAPAPQPAPMQPAQGMPNFNATNNQPQQPQQAPAAGAQIPNPFAQNQNQATVVPNNLGVEVASPTHFDGQNTVRPSVKNPSEMQPQMTPVKQPSKQEDLEKTVKKMSSLALVFGILTVVFLIAGVVGLVYGLTQSDKVATTQSALDNANLIIRAVEETSGVDSIKTPEDVPVYKATTGYIYISEWNIKIKVPENLDYVSYILNQNYRPSICFNGVGKGVQYFPDFANIALNPGRMGCLTRIATTEGSFDAATGLSFGSLVYTYKDFNYFYTGSVDYSNAETDAANLNLEHTAVQIIKNMLTDNVESYE